MWKTAEVRATVDHPVEAVFPYLVDPTTWRRFVPACVFRRRMDGGPVEPGSRWMATDRIGPFRFHFVDELAELVPQRRVVWLSSWPWNARVVYRLTRDARRTHIHATYEGDVSGVLRLVVGWLPRWAAGRILARDFHRLDQLLSREARAERRWARDHGALRRFPATSAGRARMGLDAQVRERT